MRILFASILRHVLLFILFLSVFFLLLFRSGVVVDNLST